MDLAQKFLVPVNTTHRQYEALRAYFVEKLPGPKVAQQFGYSLGSLHRLINQFRKLPDRLFFIDSARKAAPSSEDPIHLRIIQLRKQNQSVYDISEALKKEGIARTPVAVFQVLKKAGFAKLPRRMDEERPKRVKPVVADAADVRALNLEPRTVRTKFGGLFLFLPALAELGFDRVINRCDFPGTKQIPAAHAMRSLLALKLFGTQRHSHVMSAVLDEELGLFAGLNAIPKRSHLTQYSCRVSPECYPKLMEHWFDAMGSLGLQHGASFDLDFHTIPFHGEDALLEKHYISKRSRRQKGILAFLAHDGDRRFFCYANSNLRKADQNDEILRFVEFWKARTGKFPEELVFDSKLTTYRNLNKLNAMGIQFITLRRRSPQIVQDLLSRPRSAWRQIELDGVSRQYRTPRVLDEQIQLGDHDGLIRQISVADLGHEQSTLILTNKAKTTPKKVIERYAGRMLIENNIEDGVNFFHMDALSSAVALKVNCDIQLTLMASSLYRHLGQRIGNGYEMVKSRHLFRDFIDATAAIVIDSSTITVRFQDRAHNPLLLAAGFDKTDIRIP